MSSPLITEFAFDDENSEKIADHGLTVWQVLQVLGNPHIIMPNRRERRGAHLVIGQDAVT